MIKMGAKHKVCPKDDCICDIQNKIVSTPAYMYPDSKITEVFTGISKMLKKIKELSI